MALVDLESVYVVKAKGRIYHYAWRGKGAPRLLSLPGSPEYIAELAAALAGRTKGDRTRLSGLIAAYKADDAWLKDVSDKTKKSWSRWLDQIQTDFGELRIVQFDRPILTVHIRKWRDKWKATPRAADVSLEVFSRVLSFGQAEGLLQNNVVRNIPSLYRNNRASIIWTDEDLAALAAVAAPEIVWAARLAALTGMRQGDLLKLNWSHIKDKVIEKPASKSAKRAAVAEVPIYGELRRLLDEIPKRSTRVLTSTYKRPWKTGFGSSWGDAIKAAGIDKHFHDLRGTAATKMYVAGLKIREIAVILAWSEDRVEEIIDRYVKRDEILSDIIRRLDENALETETAKLPAKPSA